MFNFNLSVKIYRSIDYTGNTRYGSPIILKFSHLFSGFDKTQINLLPLPYCALQHSHGTCSLSEILQRQHFRK